MGMNSIRAWLILIQVTLAIHLVEFARADEAAFGGIRELVTRVLKTANDPQRKYSKEMLQLWQEMDVSLNELAKHRGNLSPEYADTLKADQEALKVAVVWKNPEPERLVICKTVAKDLEAKAAVAHRNQNPTSSTYDPYGAISVSVKTKHDNAEVKGCEVLYVLEGWEAKGQPKAFPEWSSPTAHRLVPGYYRMWAREQQGRRPAKHSGGAEQGGARGS